LKKLRAGKHAGRRICHTPTTTRAKWPKNFGMPDAIEPFMPKSRNLHERAFRFVVDVIALCRIVIARDALLRQVAWQLIDAAGSTGANTEEAAEGQSKADFIAKNCIALKEAREARYLVARDCRKRAGIISSCVGTRFRSIRAGCDARRQHQHGEVKSTPWTSASQRRIRPPLTPNPCDIRYPISDIRYPISDFRFPISDFRLTSLPQRPHRIHPCGAAAGDVAGDEGDGQQRARDEAERRGIGARGLIQLRFDQARQE
jgi:four helix bundle protein